MKVNISGSSAVYPVESLWSYGELERRVYSVVSKSLSETTGVVISRVLKVSGKPSVDQVLGQLHRLSMQTDLSLRDRLSIRAFMSSGQKKVFEYEVPKSTYDNVVDPDGMTFVNINSGFYSWARNKFPFDPLLLESADVVVDNISGVQGAGNSFAKMIEIAGTRVVEVKSSDFGSISTKNGCYFYSVGKYVLTEKMLIEQCGCKRIQINSSEAQKELPNNFKGIGVWLR